MQLPESLLTVFSAEIENRDGTPVVTIPDQELRVGDLEAGATYRIAVLSQRGIQSESTNDERTRGHQRGRNGSEPPVEEGELREVEIEDIGEQGDGIARVGPGYIVFVPDTDIGDHVTVEITQTRENFAFAEVREDEPISG